jgi:acetate kinase
MGFTPLEGLVMATRSGNVDPGLITWLLQQGKLGLDELATGLERSAGLAGLAGIPSGDMREVLSAADAGDEPARLALDVYMHRLRQEIAAMAAAMNGLDVLVFTGGVGEHSARVRAAAAGGLEFLGVSVDPAQDGVSSDADISGPGPVRVLVVTAREDIEIARQARAVLAGQVRAGG